MKALQYKLAGIITIILLFGSLQLNAQQPAAIPGPNGIFIYFGKNLPIGFQYKLERKTTATNADWEEIYRTVPFEWNYQVVVGKLVQSGSKTAAFTLPDSATINYFMTLVQGKRTTDSVFVFNGQVCYIETMGTGFYDVMCASGARYEYRVSEIDVKGNVLKASSFKADPYPGNADLDKPVFLKHTSTSKSLILEFVLKGKYSPAGVRVFRQIALQTNFHECFPDKLYARGKDGLTVSFIDSLVIPGVSYQYIVVPVDMLGNPGKASDTVRINFGEGMLAPLEKFEAKAENNAIVIKWKSALHKNMRSVSIFRSEQFDDGFTLLERVPANDSTYADRQIIRGISYYYYLVFQGLNETSPPSAKVIGMVEENEKPVLMPGSVKVEQTFEGNLIKWTRTETGTRGYYVYRGEGFTAVESQISTLLITDSLNVSYLDSVQNLQPGITYCYAVASVNRGNLEGPKSEVVISEAIKPELPVPFNVRAKYYNDNVMLFWDDISSMSKFITGYRVYRSEGENRIVLGESGTSAYYDSTVVRGKRYSYAVQAIGVEGSESVLSAPSEFLLDVVKPIAPSGLRATKTSEGVVLHWDAPAVANLDGYRIYREQLNGDKTTLATIDPYTTVYTDNPGTGTWFYSLTSITKENKESAPGEEVGVLVE
jgi:fibronectin type 3 domain-containing protein